MGGAQLDVSRSGALVYRAEVDTSVTWLEPSGAKERVLPDDAAGVEPSLSPDGARLAYTLSDDIWTYDVERKLRTQLTKNIQAAGPQWTPDGRFLVFGTFGNLAWMPADGGSAPRPLLAPVPGIVRYPTAIQVVGGAVRLAYMQMEVGRTEGWDVWTVPLVGDGAGLGAGAPQPYLETASDERWLTFASDGRWVAYSSTESGDRHEIYVRAFPDDGRRWQISDGGGTLPQWAPGGGSLFFQAADHTLMQAPFAVTPTGFAPGAPRQWSAQPMVGDRGPRVYSAASHAPRVVAVVADPASEARSHHVLGLWTDFVDQLRRRPADAGQR